MLRLDLSLRTRVLAGFIPLVLIPLATAIFLDYRAASSSLETAAHRSLQAAASETAARVDAFIESNLSIIQAEARLPDLAEYLQLPAYAQVAHTTRGHVRRVLEAFAAKDKVFIRSYGLLNADGRVVADIFMANEGQMEGNHLYFTSPMNTGLPFASEVYIATNESIPLIYFTGPVLDDQDRAIGVLRVGYSAALLQQITSNAAGLAGPDSYPIMVDSESIILGLGSFPHSGAEPYLLRPLTPLTTAARQTLTAAGRLPAGARRDPLPELREFGEALAQTTPASPFFNAHMGLQNTGEAAVAVTSVRRRPWRVAFVQPRDVLLAPARTHTRRMLVLAASMGLGAFLLALAVSKTLTRPIHRLKTAATALEQGDLTARASEKAGGEIGELASAFNSMADSIAAKLEMEICLADISRRFLSLTSEEVEEAIDEALLSIGQFLGADRACLCQFDPVGKTFTMTHEWSMPGRPPLFKSLQDVSMLQFPWFLKTLEQVHSITVDELDDLPPEAAAEKAFWRSMGVNSFMVHIFFFDNTPLGMLSVAHDKVSRHWRDEDERFMSMCSEILGNALARRRTALALARSEERYSLAQKAANIGSWDWELPTGRLFGSEMLPSIFGLARSEFPNRFRSYLRLVHPSDKQQLLHAVRFAFRHGGNFAVEHRTTLLDGSERWISQAGAVIRNADQKPIRVIGIARDITERKRAVASLAEMNRQLETLVEDRTRDLQQKAKELEQANVQLKELDEMKSTFVTSVSHELRTPLTSILGFAKLILKDFKRYFSPLAAEDERLRPRSHRITANTSVIVEEGERLTRLINDVLDLAKIESGKLEWRESNVNVAECLRRAVEGARGDFSQKLHVRLVTDIAHNLPIVFVDPDRLYQVCLNLLNNAAKFTERGVVTVRASAPRNNVARVEVIDTGPGIAPEEQQHIFDTFHQAVKDDTREEKPAGTGLGLAISKQIVEHFNGRIWVESEVGVGSRFVFEIPASRTGPSA